jgi:alpha,alpha-trehalase
MTPTRPRVSVPSEKQWRALDDAIRRCWDEDVNTATEEVILATRDQSLLFLPFPFVAPCGTADGAFAHMFHWDAHHTNDALLAHDRPELVRNHILNYLFMIERHGFALNANHACAATRSQVPVFPGSVWSYYAHTCDGDLLLQAYPLLKREYERYWNAPHHQTPIGLATNRDLGDLLLAPEYAAEAEAIDWSPIYAGDIRRCAPLITNCALVRYARVLALIAAAVGRADEAARFAQDADRRAELIREYCWDEEAGLFLEYDHVRGERLPYVSVCTYWTLWAGVATAGQADRLVENLHLLEKRYGLAVTDRAYSDPHRAPAYSEPEQAAGIVGGGDQLQWMYPAGWAPMHLIVVEGLDVYGFSADAERVAARFLSVVESNYQKTRQLWEKYNVVDGSLALPNSRYGNLPMRGWTAAAAALLGRRLFCGESLGEPAQAPSPPTSVYSGQLGGTPADLSPSRPGRRA